MLSGFLPLLLLSIMTFSHLAGKVLLGLLVCLLLYVAVPPFYQSRRLRRAFKTHDVAAIKAGCEKALLKKAKPGVLAVRMNNLASIHYHVGDYRKALETARDALVVLENAPGAESESLTAMTKDILRETLILSLMKLNEWEEASRMLTDPADDGSCSPYYFFTEKMLNAKFAVHNGDLESAGHYLNIVRGLTGKKFKRTMKANEANLREIEAAYEQLKNDRK
jgi:hypothetical protein